MTAVGSSDEASLVVKLGAAFKTAGNGRAWNTWDVLEFHVQESLHTLERMAPDIPQVQAEMRTRVERRLERLGIPRTSPAFDRCWALAMKKVDPRGVPPSVVEAEIMKPGSTNVRVVTARRKTVVVTVISKNPELLTYRASSPLDVRTRVRTQTCPVFSADVRTGSHGLARLAGRVERTSDNFAQLYVRGSGISRRQRSSAAMDQTRIEDITNEGGMRRAVVYLRSDGLFLVEVERMVPGEVDVELGYWSRETRRVILTDTIERARALAREELTTGHG